MSVCGILFSRSMPTSAVGALKLGWEGFLEQVIFEPVLALVSLPGICILSTGNSSCKSMKRSEW